MILYGTSIGFIKGDTRSLDYSSHNYHHEFEVYLGFKV